MKKIKTWFKTRTYNKVAIIANFVACGTNLYCGCYFVALLWLFLAVSWIIIDGYQRRLKVVCELAEQIDKQYMESIKEAHIESLKCLYYIFQCDKEKLTSNFCKTGYMMKDTKQYIKRLQQIEESIDITANLLREKQKEYNKE